MVKPDNKITSAKAAASNALSEEDKEKREALTCKFYDVQPNEVMAISCPFVDVKIRRIEKEGRQYIELITLQKADYPVQIQPAFYQGSEQKYAKKIIITKGDFIKKFELNPDNAGTLSLSMYYHTARACNVEGFQSKKNGNNIARAKVDISLPTMTVEKQAPLQEGFLKGLDPMHGRQLKSR